MQPSSLRAMERLVDFFYPRTCGCCGSSIASGYFCEQCHPSDAAPLEHADLKPAMCATCGLTSGALLNRQCIACILVPPAFDQLRTLWWYRGTVEQAIKSYKYGTARRLAPYFADRLAQFLTAYANSDELLTIVPSSAMTLRIRGFHHMAEIGRRTASKLRLHWSPRALTASGQHVQQAGQTPTARRQNMVGAFSAASHLVAGRKVLLLDDVVTSGASFNAAAEALRTAGAEQVRAVALARSPRYHLHRFTAQLTLGDCERSEVE